MHNEIDHFGKYPTLTAKRFFNGDDCIKVIIVKKISPDLVLMKYFWDSKNV